jgi:chaperonin GroES
MRATASPAPESSASSSAGPPTERDAPRVARTTMNVRPLHDRIIIERIEESEQRVGGIIIPDTAKEKPQQGKVIAVGKGRIEKDGKVTPLDVKAGDTVLFGKYAGQEIKVDGNEYLIIREEEVLGVIEK